MRLKTKGDWTEKPCHEWIFGHFIESGFGRQVDGLWSEMIYNRAFRRVPPYQEATWEWLGLDAANYHDQAPFWHSGYEECDWQPIGNPNLSYTCGTHTHKGMTSRVVTSQSSGSECGLKQAGLHLKEQTTYKLRLMAFVLGDLSQPGLDGFGDALPSHEVKLLKVCIGKEKKTFPLTTVAKVHEWQWTATKDEVASIHLSFDWQGSLVLPFVSLMPQDHCGGWRSDVVDKLTQIAPSVIRFPGGCFVSFYDWLDTIGNRDRREPQPSFYWGGLEANDVGLDEFMNLSERLRFEPQICINMMTSYPYKARQMVEYLNALTSVGMGRLRQLHGHAEPYGVRLFEMENEPGRKWTSRQYAQACVEFAREMRLADPNIRLMMACYNYPLSQLESMLEIAINDIDYVIYRRGDPDFVHQVLPLIQDFNDSQKTSIQLVNTEWLPSCQSVEPFEHFNRAQSPSKP